MARAIKGLVVCNGVDLEPLDLRNGLTLGYQPCPKVLIVLFSKVAGSMYLHICQVRSIY